MNNLEFRGHNGEDWLHGDLLTGKPADTFSYIRYSDIEGDILARMINPETVGQYIGIKDKNGVKVFNNDIVRYVYVDDGKTIPHTSRIYYSDRQATYVVDVATKYQASNGNWIHSRTKTPVHMIDLKSLEVIGNIYENPELLS